jgi:hypothetical protein
VRRRRRGAQSRDGEGRPCSEIDESATHCNRRHKHIDLLPQDQVFRFQRCSRLEARNQGTEDQLEQIGHQDASLSRPPAASTLNRIFGTHRRPIGALLRAGQQRAQLRHPLNATRVRSQETCPRSM